MIILEAFWNHTQVREFLCVWHCAFAEMIKRDAQADDSSQTLPFPKPTSTTDYNIGNP